MGVKSGYKYSEMGIIPEDWDAQRLGDLAEFVTSGSRGWAQFYSESGALFIRSQNVRDGRLNFEDVQYVSPPDGAEGNRTKVKLNDLLITITGSSVGNVASVEDTFDEAYISQHVGLVRLKEPTRGAYVCRYLSPNAPGNPQIAGSQSGQSKPGLNLKNLRDFWIALPPTPNELHAIATALGDVDALLDSLDRLIFKKRNLKQAAMQQLLTGKTRLPGFNCEWETKALSEIATISKGTQLHSSKANPNGHFPHLNGGISPSGWTDAFNTPANSIAISEGGNSCGYVQFVSQPFWCGGHCYAVLPKSVDKKFLFQALKGQQTAIMGLRVGSGLPNVQKTALVDFKLSIPSEQDEQTAIAEVLSDMDTELAALEQRRDKTCLLKQGMMQELLTGRVRLMAEATNVVPFPAERSPAAPTDKPHNWQINEAVVIAVLVERFGSEQFPLGRKRYTKLSYLLHRHVERTAAGYLKKAAGPYNPATKYKGPEGIAQRNGYMRSHANGQYSGFVAADKIADAQAYFHKWYGEDALQWLEQFRFKKNDDLELLATVDMAMEDLRRAGAVPTLDAVKRVIHDHPEWEAKLSRPLFSNTNIAAAMKTCEAMFNGGTGEFKSR